MVTKPAEMSRDVKDVLVQVRALGGLHVPVLGWSHSVKRRIGTEHLCSRLPCLLHAAAAALHPQPVHHQR